MERATTANESDPCGAIGATDHLARREAHRSCTSFDVLVRSTRADRANAERLAPRVAESLRALAEPVAILPRSIAYGGSTLLEAAGGEARWTLAAYMAGLRGLRFLPALSAENLLELATRLGALRVEATDLEAFRDYLWSGGADGLEVQLAPSFVEVATTMEVVGRTQNAIGAMRAFAAFSEEGVKIKTPELDAAALDVEFDVAVDPLRAAWRTRSIESSNTDFATAHAAFADAPAWARAELDLPIDVEALRPVVPPRRAARRLTTWLTGASALGAVEYFTELVRSSDAFVASTVAAAACEELGEKLGTKLELSQGAVRAATTRLLASNLDDATRLGVTRALLRRAAAEPEALGVLQDWARAGGDVALVTSAAHPSWRGGSDAHWRTAASALGSSASSAALALWSKTAPLAIIAETAAPLDVVGKMGMACAALLLELAPSRRAVLLTALLATEIPSDALADIVAEVAVGSHGSAVDSRLRHRALSLMLRTARSRAALVTLTEDRKAEDDVRIAALEVGAKRSELAPELFATRLSALLFDTEPVRRRRAELKKAAKPSSRRRS